MLTSYFWINKLTLPYQSLPLQIKLTSPKPFLTSHSTPHVTGVVALLLNTPVGSYDFNYNGKWDPDEVMKKLKDRARDILDPGFDTTSGYGLVDA